VLYLIHRKGWLLILSGLSWGLAVLARYDTLISVLVYTGFVLVYFWLSHRQAGAFDWKQALRRAALLLAPLAICALALAWYNDVRFGSPLETGFRYQLTTPVLSYYSSSFVKTNLYLYLFYPNPIIPRYPFVTIQRFHPQNVPAWASLTPGKQYDFGFFGLFHSTPIFWFIGLALLLLIVTLIVRNRRGLPLHFAGRQPVFWLMGMLLLAGLLQLVFLLFYYYSAVRFLSDFWLPLLAFGILVIWELDSYLVNKPRTRTIYWAALTLLALQTVVIGFFSGLNLFPYYFAHRNPTLYKAITNYFAPMHSAIFTFLKPFALSGQFLLSLIRNFVA
jgi:hypothetical protein